MSVGAFLSGIRVSSRIVSSTTLAQAARFRSLSTTTAPASAAGMDLRDFVNRFESLFPLQLAEKWDNVGLLVEPSGVKTVSKVMLTNDLTEDVLEESVAAGVDLILSYHPPIFRPMKRLAQNNWKVRSPYMHSVRD